MHLCICVCVFLCALLSVCLSVARCGVLGAEEGEWPRIQVHPGQYVSPEAYLQYFEWSENFPQRQKLSVLVESIVKVRTGVCVMRHAQCRDMHTCTCSKHT